MTKDELKEKANDLPLSPGVYLMMDKTGKVIYVGKAKKLKNRVSQYFQDSASHTAKTRQMVSQVDHFDTIFVSSEFEALVLENSLIKRHMPRYNILLKDDKGYPFVRLSREAYPRFTMTNKVVNDSARYFGPFGGRFETRQALDAVLAALRLPTCNRRFPKDIGAERPCLNFHMGRCDGFCRPDMTAEEYNRRIQQACQLLEGKSKQLLREMTAEMEAEAEALRFEQAAQLRDRINAISALSSAAKRFASGDLSYRARVVNNDEIGKLTEDFNTMAEKLEDNIKTIQDAADRQKTFMGNFAHEMKNPMTSIIGYAELIRSQTLTEGEQMDAANYIFSEGKRLEALGLKLLDMLSLDQSKLQLVPASPADLVAGLLEHLKRVYAQKGIALQYRTAEGTCFLEPDLFKTLLVNLMDNARKALDNGGYIRQGKPERYIREEFAKWVNSKGMRLKGLVIRRQWEADRYYGKEA